MAVCYLGIGSNLGNRRKNIELALKKIKSIKGLKIIATSSIISTAAVGGPVNQNRFLNCAVKILIRITPLYLLKKLKEIEKEMGRVKTVRNGPRIIDIDILLFGNLIINKKELKVPHPRMFERDFVMRPLLELI
ncbi:MAG: 2-amino-4-hydroxy-6-hydroxymethyldihydropteridine diphosphokinase [Candidatus Omnitrophota bacterium]|jgi:2-amino-4-hydroxy-6-hydroxymethyldihydropteridine diphosphokinase|nr:MAG: 2-amino-4-hydroxy-6-hydroxymethyldihydropteridine diphosphokinase [Candidatus Omnitrophota bacterium]